MDRIRIQTLNNKIHMAKGRIGDRIVKTGVIDDYVLEEIKKIEGFYNELDQLTKIPIKEVNSDVGNN